LVDPRVEKKAKSSSSVKKRKFKKKKPSNGSHASEMRLYFDPRQPIYSDTPPPVHFNGRSFPGPGVHRSLEFVQIDPSAVDYYDDATMKKCGPWVSTTYDGDGNGHRTTGFFWDGHLASFCTTHDVKTGELVAFVQKELDGSFHGVQYDSRPEDDLRVRFWWFGMGVTEAEFQGHLKVTRQLVAFTVSELDNEPLLRMIIDYLFLMPPKST
jgi:hypothetical protein